MSDGRGSRVRRTGLAVAIGAGTLALVASACGGEGLTSGGGNTVRIAYQVIPNSAPIVKHEGWLEDELDMDVEWRQYDAGADVNQAVAAGSVDIGLAGSTLVANGIATGLPYEVPWIYDVIGDNEALVARGEIASIKDLEGKKIATPLGSTTQYSLVAALEEAGVDPSDVSILDMEPPDALAAWKNGSIDAAYVWHPTLQQMIDDGGKVLVTSGDLAKQGTVTADLGIVSTDFANEHPDVVADWLRAENRGVRLIKDDPQQAAQIVADEFGTDQDTIATQMKDLIILNGRQQLTADQLGTAESPGALSQTLHKTAEFLVDNDLIDSAPGETTFEDVVDPSYLQHALGG
ncbi:taurine ABC transporter substrate-binding protein [Solicola gregarius]|uniref:ABC transporter substrate-binding protein n=1 Tax=Solicola gregarius TaxID=2908642 RepID=A0AA46YM78_9ACTN|nr:ABC transporter substrate-binding protein [Solicola gregarius]UYM07785.1 ABC transporter substrate-binding protein [Solicola gregarius]